MVYSDATAKVDNILRKGTALNCTNKLPHDFSNLHSLSKKWGQIVRGAEEQIVATRAAKPGSSDLLPFCLHSISNQSAPPPTSPPRAAAKTPKLLKMKWTEAPKKGRV